MTRALLVLAASMIASSAFAHDDIDEARRLYEEAELDQALDALARAQDNGLTRDELLEMLDLRLVLNLSLGNDDAVTADLRVLAAIDPDHELPPELPPGPQDAFIEIVEATEDSIGVSIEMESSPAAAVFTATTTGDTQSLISSIRIRARTPNGLWAEDNNELVLPLTSSLDVYYYAEALGPGGAVLATRGSEDEPLVARYAPRGEEEDDSGGGGLSSGAIIGIGVGVAALVALAVLVAVLGRGGDGPDSFQPSNPMVEF